jgi:Arc/MetJ family transcription regulator
MQDTNAPGGEMAKTLVDIDEDALALAMAHYGTTVKRDAINRALREVAEKRLHETDELEEWIVEVGGRLAETDWSDAWRQ